MSLFQALLADGVSNNFVLSGSTIVFDKARFKFNPHAPSPNLYTPAILWDSATGDVLIFTNLDIHDYFSRGYVIPYFNNLGIDRPIPVGFAPGNPDDPHSRQAGVIVNNLLHIVVEHPHNTSYWLFRAQNAGDYYAMDLLAGSEWIGTDCSYPQIHKLADDSFLLISGQQSNDDPGKNDGDSNFDNFGSDTTMVDPGGSANTRYFWTPPQSRAYASGWKYLIVADNPGLLYQDVWLMKTQDGVNMYNWDESFNTSIMVSNTDLANYHIFNPGGGIGGNAFQPTLAMDADENFYMCVYSETLADYVLVTLYQGESVPTINALGQTDYVQDTASITGQGAVVEIIVISPTNVLLFIRRDPTAFSKVYQYRTTNRGLTSTLIGDTLPDINANIGRWRVPHNVCDIPVNTNFLIFASEMVATGEEPADVYIRRAVFGTLQSDTDTLFGVTGYTKAEYDALMIRSYYAEHSTRSGSNLTALTDQSPTGSNTSVPAGAPQYNNDDGEYYSFSGSNQFTIFAATADILALTQGTIWVVAKKDTSVNNTCYFLTGSVIGTANKMIGFGIQQGGTLNNSIQTTNCHAGTGSGVFQSYGEDAVDDEWHIFCYQFSDQTCGQLFIDGKKQPYNWISPSPSGDDVKFNRSGTFFNKLTSINRIAIGRLSQAVNTDFDFKLRHISIMSTPMTFEQFRKTHKYLSDRYSIPLTSVIQ